MTAGEIFSASDTNIAADLYLYSEGHISLVAQMQKALQVA